MPSGKYERKPFMKSTKNLISQREKILSLHALGFSQNAIAKQFKLSRHSIRAVLIGDWNPYRASREES